MPNMMVQCILGIKIVQGLHLVVNEKAKDSKHKVHIAYNINLFRAC